MVSIVLLVMYICKAWAFDKNVIKRVNELKIKWPRTTLYYEEGR